MLSRDLLLSDVWGYQYTGGTRTVDVHVRRLREKLPVLVHAIETIKQFGYKLKARRTSLEFVRHCGENQATARRLWPANSPAGPAAASP